MILDTQLDVINQGVKDVNKLANAESNFETLQLETKDQYILDNLLYLEGYFFHLVRTRTYDINEWAFVYWMNRQSDSKLAALIDSVKSKEFNDVTPQHD